MTTARDRAYLKGQLASVGILLEDRPTDVARPQVVRDPITTDERDEMRRILMSAGAPPRSLEWLVASCPSIDDARTYRAPTGGQY